MVAGDRGAVLPPVAVTRVRRGGRGRAGPCGRGHGRGRRGDRVRRPARLAVGAGRCRARVHGHRREDLRADARRGRRGVRRVAGWPRSDRPSRAMGAGGGRGGRVHRARNDHAGRSRLLPGRRRPDLRRHARDRGPPVGGRRGRHRPVLPLVAAARVDRRRLLRRLPLALAGHALAGVRDPGVDALVLRQIAAALLTFGIAAVSFSIVERPIRSGTFLAARRAPAAHAAGAATGRSAAEPRSRSPRSRSRWSAWRERLSG